MVDYSKWKDIEISDDEDDTHPNIDTGSLFRWRHQARMERMAEEQREKEELAKKEQEARRKAEEIRKKLESEMKSSVDLSQLESELHQIEKVEKEINTKKEEMTKKEKLSPWNVDTISKEGFTKTLLNKKPEMKPKEQLTEEEFMERQREFVRNHEPILKQFGMLQKYDDSKRFLQEHPEICREETANYLVIWCVNLVVEEKENLMEHVSHQCICMQYILELGKQLEVDPRACVGSFFTRIQTADKQYKDAFDDELKAFKGRVRERGQKRIDEAIKQIEEEERLKRLGPGGLDPADVFETLPEAMQKCFESRDIALLQSVIKELPEEEARYHMKRCIDSGLWVPDAKTLASQGLETTEDSEEFETKETSGDK